MIKLCDRHQIIQIVKGKRGAPDEQLIELVSNAECSECQKLGATSAKVYRHEGHPYN